MRKASDKSITPAENVHLDVRDAIIHAHLDGLRELAHKSGNPLYAWQAIAWCGAHDRTCPDWVQSYLLASAIKLLNLAARSGGSLEVDPVRAGDPVRVGEPFHITGEEYKGRRQLNAKEALTGVPWALGLGGGRGKNSFADLRNDVDHLRDLGLYEALKLWPPQAGAESAADSISKRRGLSAKDPADRARSLRRRLSKARNLKSHE